MLSIFSASSLAISRATVIASFFACANLLSISFSSLARLSSRSLRSFFSFRFRSSSFFVVSNASRSFLNASSSCSKRSLRTSFSFSNSARIFSVTTRSRSSCAKRMRSFTDCLNSGVFGEEIFSLDAASSFAAAPYAAREANGDGRSLPFFILPLSSSSSPWRCKTPGIAHGCDTEPGYFPAMANNATANATHAVPIAMNGGEYSAHCTKASSRLRGFALVFLMSTSMASVKSCGETTFFLDTAFLLLLLDLVDDSPELLVLPARRGTFVKGFSIVPLVSLKAS